MPAIRVMPIIFFTLLTLSRVLSKARTKYLIFKQIWPDNKTKRNLFCVNPLFIFIYFFNISFFVSEKLPLTGFWGFEGFEGFDVGYHHQHPEIFSHRHSISDISYWQSSKNIIERAEEKQERNEGSK